MDQTTPTFASATGTVKDTPMTRASKAEQFRFMPKDSLTARQDKVQHELNELHKKESKGKGKDDKDSCLVGGCWIKDFGMAKVIYNDPNGETYGRSYTIDTATGEVTFGSAHEVDNAGWVKSAEGKE